MHLFQQFLTLSSIVLESRFLPFAQSWTELIFVLSGYGDLNSPNSGNSDSNSSIACDRAARCKMTAVATIFKSTSARKRSYCNCDKKYQSKKQELQSLCHRQREVVQDRTPRCKMSAVGSKFKSASARRRSDCNCDKKYQSKKQELQSLCHIQRAMAVVQDKASPGKMTVVARQFKRAQRRV